MSRRFIGIDTSNYTTSFASCEDSRILVNSKVPVSVKPGERGVRQNDAVFSHVQNIPQAISRLGKGEYTAIGVSTRPRPIEGSYMPCFLSGVAVAESLATTLGIPLYRFSHQEGHVRAALYSANRLDLVSKTFVAFHVSGGTTEVLLYDKGDIRLIGETLDINAGQLIDRVGVQLGVSFPCGPSLDAVCDFEAMRSEGITPMTKVKELTCNLSGLENKAMQYLQKGASHGAVAAFVISSVCKTLEKLSQNALDLYGDLCHEKTILFSGGVSGNSFIQKTIRKKFNAYFAEPTFSSDNAAGIALLCEERYSAEYGN